MRNIRFSIRRNDVLITADAGRGGARFLYNAHFLPVVLGLFRKCRASYCNLPRAAWLLSSVVLIHNAGRMVSTFLAIYLFVELDFTELWIGIAVTAYGTGAVAGSLAGGWLSTRFFPRTIILSSLVLLGLGFFCLSLVTDPLTFTALLFAGALFEGMFRPPLLAYLMAAAAPIDRPRFYALYQSSSNLGQAIGAMAGGVLAEARFSLIFWVDGGTSLLAATVLVCALPAARTAISPDRGSSRAAAPSHNLTWPLLVLCLVGLLNYAVVNQRLSVYPLYLTTDYGLQPSAFGALMMLNGLMIAALGVLIVDAMKETDQRKVASLGSILLCGGFAILPFGDSFAFAAFACVVMTLGEILLMPSIVALVYGLSREEAAGQVIGLFFAALSACRALGPVAGVWAFAIFGPTPTWLACSGLGVISVLLLLGTSDARIRLCPARR